ncbi:urease accessory protein UreD [Prauserella rugosa]|uniref:Urease accessory protein UreD n=1 Tax=Prauserella rugosa TaxID=43354 RepID=A0A660CIP3_9PSEU|nr:urease accessory protein UreD [Prauserella rugosa]KMS87936.1 urease accessory protein ureD [Streptomyces regensis]TWH20951.1 urease accessory protein [Prauserella rugosa]
MRATARLTAEFDGVTGRTVLRQLRSMAPLTLFPRAQAGSGVGAGVGTGAQVHLVNSATAPLGGDDLVLHVRVGEGASLRLSGVAATLALPGQSGGESAMAVHVEVADGGRFEYLPEPTVVTARARHHARLTVDLDGDARLRTREVLVLGREGERPGTLTTATHVVRAGMPMLRQELTVGEEQLDRSPAYLAGRRVLGTEIVAGPQDESVDGGVDPADRAVADRAVAGAAGALSGQWWSVTPLPAGGALATVLGVDAVTAERDLARAVEAWLGRSRA